jgi:predicted CXXCH cytochrome family protein
VHDPGDEPVGLRESGEEEKSRRRRAAAAIAILLLLLLLCCFCAILSRILWRTTPAKTTLIADNRGCLQCHTELLGEYQMSDVHNPFLTKQCTVCHTDHGQLFIKQYLPARMVVYKRCGLIITFEPLRKLFSQRCGTCGRFGNLVKGAQTGANARETTVPPSFIPSKLLVPEPALCFTCHRSVSQASTKRYQHPPFKRGDCSHSCHRPHASMTKRLLIEPIPALCLRCHKAKLAKDYGLADQHKPFKAGQCVLCHQPHASDFKKILVKRQRDLCFGCHPQIAVLAGLPVQHSPFINGECTGCHRPHASTPKFLLNSPEPPLCYSCHAAIKNDFLRPSHHPVGTPLLNCSSCHQPHAALYRRLLIARDNALCYTCHGGKQLHFEASAHRKLSLLAAPGLCINCHTPHGSDWKPLLVKDKMALCLTCHPTKISRQDLVATMGGPVSRRFVHHEHPVGYRWRDRHAGGPLTCVSSCHDPHGTGRPWMVKRMPDGLCLECHPLVSLK